MTTHIARKVTQSFQRAGPSSSPTENLSEREQEVERNETADTPKGQKKEQAQTILEAHEALCEAAPENLTRFKDVLDYLKQDLHQETAGK